MRLINAGSAATVELGCGRRKVQIEGHQVIGVDRRPFEGVDIVADLENTPWAWADPSSCRLVVVHQTLEHIRDIIGVMNEIWRICDEEAFVEVVVPYGAGASALQDPTHVRFFIETTFEYWEPGFVEAFGDYGIAGYFAICYQNWRHDGNLWTILKPLKTLPQLEWWLARKAEAGAVRWPAPDWLVERAARLVGERP